MANLQKFYYFDSPYGYVEGLKSWMIPSFRLYYNYVYPGQPKCSNCLSYSEMDIEFPIKEFVISEIKAEIMWGSDPGEFHFGILVSQRLRDLFVGEGITGVRFYRFGTEFLEERAWMLEEEFEGEHVPFGTYLMVFQGKAARINRESVIYRVRESEATRLHLEFLEHCPECHCLDVRYTTPRMFLVGEYNVRKLMFFPDDWNGNDIFRVNHLIVVTERVIELLKNHGIDNWYASEAYPVNEKR